MQNLNRWLDGNLFLFSLSVMFNSLWPHGLEHARLPCPFPSPKVLLKLTFIELVMPSNHLILCCSLLLLPSIFPSIRIFFFFFYNELAVHISWPKNIRVSASASVLPMNNQGWFPLRLTDLISWQSMRFSRVFSNIGVWKDQFLQHQSCFSSSILWKLQSCFISMLIFRVCDSQKQSVQYQDIPESSNPLDTFLSPYC